MASVSDLLRENFGNYDIVSSEFPLMSQLSILINGRLRISRCPGPSIFKR